MTATFTVHVKHSNGTEEHTIKNMEHIMKEKLGYPSDGNYVMNFWSSDEIHDFVSKECICTEKEFNEQVVSIDDRFVLRDTEAQIVVNAMEDFGIYKDDDTNAIETLCAYSIE